MAGNAQIDFIGVEMASLPSYALAGFLKGKRRSSEAALKYVVYGGGAAGIMLYGSSLLAAGFRRIADLIGARAAYGSRALELAFGRAARTGFALLIAVENAVRSSVTKGGTRLGPANWGAIERAEAEAILDGDRETAVALLLRVGELIEAN